MAGKFNLADHIQSTQLSRPRDIEVITGEILDAKRAGGEAILTIGKGLIEAKALLPHGEWRLWLAKRVNYSERTAQGFMQIARAYTNPQLVADLGVSKALMLLTLPEETRNEFIAIPHMVGDEAKSVIDMSRQELKAVMKGL